MKLSPTHIHIPDDIIQYIFDFIQDYDYKIYFGYIYKLNLKPFENIKTIIRSEIPCPFGLYKLYLLPNLYEYPERSIKNIPNDLLEIRFSELDNDETEPINYVHSNAIYVQTGIYRLRPRYEDMPNVDKHDIFLVDDPNYFWDYVEYQYYIC